MPRSSTASFAHQNAACSTSTSATCHLNVSNNTSSKLEMTYVKSECLTLQTRIKLIPNTTRNPSKKIISSLQRLVEEAVALRLSQEEPLGKFQNSTTSSRKSSGPCVYLHRT